MNLENTYAAVYFILHLLLRQEYWARHTIYSRKIHCSSTFSVAVSNYRITQCNWFLRPEQTLLTINHCMLFSSQVFFATLLYLTSGRKAVKYRRVVVRLIFQFLMMGFPSVSILAMMSWQLSWTEWYTEYTVKRICRSDLAIV